MQLQRQQEYVGVTNRKTEIERSLQDALRQQKQQDQVAQWVADYASQTAVTLTHEPQVAEQQAHWLLEQETQQAQQAELADVLLYLVRLASVLGVDLDDAAPGEAAGVPRGVFRRLPLG